MRDARAAHGCSWRRLPSSFPAWPTVYKSFSRWALRGVFEVMQDRLRAQWRERLQRDSQCGECGFDAGKKVNGSERPLVVAQACAKLPTLKRLCVDGAYAGQCAQALHAGNDRCRRLVMHQDRSTLIATA